MSINIRLASIRKDEMSLPAPTSMYKEPLLPGDHVVLAEGFMSGPGTYEDDTQLISSQAGRVETVNKLVCVRPLKTRYAGEVGDVIIGRILEVGQKRWKVETRSFLDSVLLLSSVNLAGGEQRRRSEEDERAMRDYLEEMDLISAEVHSKFSDGSLSLHTRSLKYGKLGQGVLVAVSPSLIRRRKNHFHHLPCGATIILGNNGFIWICPTSLAEGGQTGEEGGGFVQNLEIVNEADREAVCRLRSVILCLAHHKVMLYDTSILYAYEHSLTYKVTEINQSEASLDIVTATLDRLQS